MRVSIKRREGRETEEEDRGRKERKALRFLKTAKRVLVLEAAASLVLSLSRVGGGEVPPTGGRKGR